MLAIAIKKSQWILEAATKKEIQAILNPQAPRYDGNKFYPDKYMPPEEEAICWCALPLHEACQIMYLSGFPAENWQDTLPDEGGTVTNGFGMELSEHLFRKNLDFAWERKFIISSFRHLLFSLLFTLAVTDAERLAAHTGEEIPNAKTRSIINPTTYRFIFIIIIFYPACEFLES